MLTVATKTKSPRLYAHDRNSGYRFLIDTGSDVSILPKSYLPTKTRFTKVEYSLNAANKSKIKTYGLYHMKLNLGLPEQQNWNFIICDVEVPILGADFLSYFHLLPDLKSKRLYCGKTLCSAKCVLSDDNTLSVNLVKDEKIDERVKKLFEEFPALLLPPKYHEKPNHDVMHYIHTKGPPIAQKVRRLRPDVLQRLRKQFEEMVKIGLCSPSSSQWASPLVVVTKKEDERIASDYRRLNERTVPDKYPLNDLRDATSLLSGKKVFSKLDLIRAFHNIRVFPKHIYKTAVITPFGLFEYNRMPFGLKNAPATFQRFMNMVLSGLDFVFCYLDDIFLFSDSYEQHLEHLRLIFQRLSDYGLSLNIKKCEFFCSQVNFLGFEISEGVFRPTEERVHYIKHMERPKTITALRRVIGLLGFYRRFCRHAATLLAPFSEILKGHPRKNDRTPVNWTPQLSKQFKEVCEAFANFTLLHFPRNDTDLILTCDASKVGVGAVLEQIVNGERQPLGFYSEKLDDAQRLWSTYDRELYSIYAAVNHFSYLIEGRVIHIVTDHRPLVHIFSSKARIRLERRARWVEFISQYTTSISHTSGLSNIVADALSRPETSAIGSVQKDPPVPLSIRISEAQKDDNEVQEFRRSGYRDHVLRELLIDEKTGASVLCSEFEGSLRPIIPSKLRFEIFKLLHNPDHSGGKATMRKINRRYFWPGINRDIRNWVKSCHQCQLVKTQRHTISELGKFPPSDRFQHVHIDIVILKVCQDYRYLLTMIDRATRWIEVIPMPNMEAETVARKFFENWVSRYGVPLKITSDRGAQFQRTLFKELCHLLGTNQLTTTAYNPKANGMVERIHRRLKEALRAHGKNWLNALPTVLLALRAAPREDDGISCAEMAFGRNLILPGEFFGTESHRVQDTTKYVQSLRDSIQRIAPKPTNWTAKKRIFVHKDLRDCKKVYIRVDRVKQPLEAPYEGPFMVKRRHKKYFVILKNGKEDAVSIDRLKPAYEMSTEPTNDPSSNEPEPTSNQQTPILKKRVSFYSNLPADLADNHLCIPPPNSPPSPPTPPLPPQPPQTFPGNRVAAKRVTFDLPKTTSSGRPVHRPARYADG